MNRNLTLQIVRTLAAGSVAACVVVGLSIFIEDPLQSGARHVTAESVPIATASSQNGITIDLLIEKAVELADLLGCLHAKEFAVKKPAVVGFTCAPVEFPGRFVTGFMFHGTVDVEYLNEKRARACTYAQDAGRDVAYIIGGENWFVWTLYRTTLESATQQTNLALETLSCNG